MYEKLNTNEIIVDTKDEVLSIMSNEVVATETKDFVTIIIGYNADTHAPEIPFPKDYNGKVKEYSDKHGVYLVYFMRYNISVSHSSKEIIQRFLFVFNNGMLIRDGFSSIENDFICTALIFSSYVKPGKRYLTKQHIIDIQDKVKKYTLETAADEKLMNELKILVRTFIKPLDEIEKFKDFAVTEYEKFIKDKYVTIEKYNKLEKQHIDDMSLYEELTCKKYDTLEKKHEELNAIHGDICKQLEDTQVEYYALETKYDNLLEKVKRLTNE